MQVDVGQDRADPRSLRGADLRVLVNPVFQNPGPQPLAYEPEDARVGDPVRDHPFQPGVVNAPEEVTDIRIDDPVHPLRNDRRMNGAQGAVCAPPWAEAIRAVAEIGLINGIENLSHRALDNLVLERRDAKGSLPSVSLRM